MKPSTIRSLLITCLILDLALLAVVVYDYYQNDSDWILYVLGTFAVFVLLTAILFALSPGRRDEVVVREVVKEVRTDTSTHTHTHTDIPWTTAVSPPIPPAPVGPLNLRSTGARPPALAAAPEGPFKYNGYTLHTRQVELANAGGKRTIYFFSKKKPKSGRPCAKPPGYHVGVNERTGLPFLKKGRGPDGEDLTPAAAADDEYRPQCAALTADGAQCRNSARGGSKYCGSHFGYQPKTLKGSAKRIEGEDWSEDDDLTDRDSVKRADTKAKVKGAKDTRPAIRKSFLGRFRLRRAGA